MKQFETVDGGPVLVLNSGANFFACQAICPHLDTPLEEGMFDGSTLTCHQHLWQWDIETGEGKGLAEMPIECFAVKAENGVLYVSSEATPQ
jgi:toluene monooxygenase system ferredoxin subunit